MSPEIFDESEEEIGRRIEVIAEASNYDHFVIVGWKGVRFGMRCKGLTPDDFKEGGIAWSLFRFATMEECNTKALVEDARKLRDHFRKKQSEKEENHAETIE